MGSNPVEVLNFSGFFTQLAKIAFIAARIIASLEYTTVLYKKNANKFRTFALNLLNGKQFVIFSLLDTSVTCKPRIGF